MMAEIIPFPTKEQLETLEKKKKDKNWVPYKGVKNPLVPGLEVREFKVDLEGLSQLADNTGMSTDELFQILPDDMINAIFEDISSDLQNNNKVSDVHDVCFDVQLLAEQYPEHAGYIEKQVQTLIKQLMIFLNNVKKVDK